MNDTNKMPCDKNHGKHRNRSNNPVLYNLNQYKSTPHVSPGMNFKSTFVESIQKEGACSCMGHLCKEASFLHYIHVQSKESWNIAILSNLSEWTSLQPVSKSKHASCSCI